MKAYKHILLTGICMLWYSLNAVSQLCPNNALAPVFKQDFGQGATSASITAAPAGSTNYGFGNVGTDGNYIITPMVDNAYKGDWTHGGDHTGNPNGNMFLVNAGGGNSIFFQQTVNGLCSGSVFNFSAWLVNVNTATSVSGGGASYVYAKVVFKIKDLLGNLLASYTTGNLPISPVNGPPNWQQYGFQFSLPAGTTALSLEIDDYYGGAPAYGNDLALDDIMFSACTPQVNLSLSTSSSICSGSSTTISSSLINSPFLSPAYQWQKSTDNGATWSNIGVPSTTANSYSITNAGAADGALYRLLVGPTVSSLSSQSCVTASNAIALTVNSVPSVTVTAANPVCSGLTLTLASNASGGTGPYVYNWSGPNSFSSAQANPAIGNIGFSASGNYLLALTDANGCSASGQTAVTVQQTPVLTIANTIPALCTGNNVSIQPASSVSGSTYAWTATTVSGSASGYTSQATGTLSNTITDVITNSLNIPAIVQYQILATAPSGCSVSGFTNVLVEPAIINQTDTARKIICSGQSVTITGQAASGGNGSYQYQWQKSTDSINWVPVTGATGISLSIVPDTSMYIRRMVTSSPCNSISLLTAISINPLPVLTITNTIPTLCSGSNVFIQPHSSVSGSTYAWTATIVSGSASGFISKPVGTFSNTITDSITNGLSTPAIVQYQILATTPFGCSASGFTNVLIDPVIVNQTDTTHKTICSGQSVTITGQAASGGNGSYQYQWQKSTDGINWIAIPGATGISVTFVPDTSVSVRRTITSLPCSSIGLPAIISLNPVPVLTINNTIATLCSGSNVFIQPTSSINGSTYAWTATIISGSANGFISKPVGTLSNTITDSITNSLNTPATVQYQILATTPSGCSASGFTNVLIDPAIINQTDTTHQTVCSGQSITITGQAASGGNGSYQYQWQKSVDGMNWIAIPGATGISITFVPDTSVYVRRTIASSPCSSISAVTGITVQPALANNTITGTQEICIGLPVQTITGSVPTGGNGIYQYQWQLSTDSGITWTLINNASGINLSPDTPALTTSYRRIISSGYCNGTRSYTSAPVTITIRPTAKAGMTIAKPIGCAPFTADSAAIHPVLYPGQNSSYQWYANNVLIGQGNFFPGFTLTNDSVVIKLKTISLFQCLADSVQTTLKVYATPKPSFTVSDTSGCGPLQVSIANTSANIAGFQYSWNLGNGQNTNQAQPGTITYPTAVNGTDTSYTIRLNSYLYCDTVTVTQQITVHRKALLHITDTLFNTCSPVKAVFTNQSAGVQSQYHLWFGDGSDSAITANGTYAHTYHTGMSTGFQVLVTGTNSCGTDSSYITLPALPNPVTIQVSLSDTLACGNPFTVTVHNQTGSANQFTWNWGDGSSSLITGTAGDIQHTYTQPGAYTITDSIKGVCSDSIVYRKLNIYPAVAAVMNVAAKNSCIGIPVAFSNLSDSSLSFQWNFGDGAVSDTAVTSHIFKQPGNYTPALTVWRSYGGFSCYDTSKQNIQIVAQEPGKFFLSDTVGRCRPFAVSFINQTTPSVQTKWSWGDGTTSEGDTVQHSFLNDGKYTVTLRAKQAGGCVYTDSSYVTITSPNINLQYKGGVYCTQNSSIDFTPATNYTDSIRWDFGDGVLVTTAAQKISHVYNRPGIFLPKLTLLNSQHCAMPVTASDTILIDEIKPGFSLSGTNQCGKTLYQFTDTSQSFFNISQRSWTLGQTTAVAGQNTVSGAKQVSYVYTEAGNYQAGLQVQNSIGCSATLSAKFNVLVYDYPLANINAISNACMYSLLQIQSTISSQDSVALRLWNLGNGIKANDSTVKISYYTPGNYTIQLTVSTVNSCYDSAYKEIAVHAVPNITLPTSPAICKGASAQLTASGAMSYIWKDQNDSILCSNCNGPLVSPQKNTQYTVIGYNQYGCSNIVSTNVYVIQPFTITINPVSPICIGDSKMLTVNGAYSYTWLPEPGLNSYTSASPVASPTVTTRYQVIGTDSYHCFEDTASIQVVVGTPTPIHIGRDTVAQSGVPIQLNANNTATDIVQWQWSGKADFSCTSCASPEVKLMDDAAIICNATNQFGCITTDTLTVKTFCSNTEVFVPNAFTPDGDGVNDRLVVQGQGIKLIKNFRIFSRWGEMVFEKTNFQPGDRSAAWDGTVRGKKANADVFVYVCEVVCDKGTSSVFKGNVAIIK